MLAGINAEVLTRVAATRSFLRTIENHEVNTTTLGGDAASRTGKGLVFIQNYATYEYTVNQSVRALIDALNTRTIPLTQVRTELLALALHAEFESIIKGALKKTWESRSDLLRKTRSNLLSKVHDNLFPKDGSHYRAKQLETIWSIFGIPGPIVPEEKIRSHIEEMVENRNKIAHGVDSAESIGRRYTLAELSTTVDKNEALCSHIIAAISNHVKSPNAFI